MVLVRWRSRLIVKMKAVLLQLRKLPMSSPLLMKLLQRRKRSLSNQQDQCPLRRHSSLVS